MPKPRAYLIDSSIYIFRAWYIYDPAIIDTSGRPVNAVVGFSDFLWQLIRQKNPDLLACAFDDSQTDSFRKALFPAYKANREPAPPELKHQFNVCRDLCRVLGIPVFGSNRFEADDLIGSLAARLRSQGYAVTVVSADKDLAQLITGEEDAWWDFARGTVLNHAGVERHFGVRPEQIPDMLALSGDKIDNIPGIPGIGYKLAGRLLQKYSSIEDILGNIEAVARMKFRGAVRTQALLRKHQDILPLSKTLATIVTNIEMEYPDLHWQGPAREGFGILQENLPPGGNLAQRWLSL